MTAPARAATELLAEAIDAVDAQLDADEQQLGLFSEPVTEAGRAKLRIVRPGRPLGARNKRTEATVAHLLARYRDPRAIGLERIQMHPADLAALIGCSVAEAEERQRLWAVAVMPFLHARITPEVIDNRQVINLTIGSFGGAGAGEATSAGPILVLDPADGQVIEGQVVETIAEGASAETASEPEA